MRTKLIINLLLVAALMLFSQHWVFAQADSFNTMTDVSHVTEDSGTQKVIITTARPVEYRHFQFTKDDNQHMIIIDIFKVVHDWPAREMEGNGDPIIRIRSAQNEMKPVEIVRVVIEVSQIIPYTVSKKDNKITLGFDYVPLPIEKPEEPVKPMETVTDRELSKKPAQSTSITRQVTKQEVATIGPEDRLISLNFEDADIRDVFTALSLKTGINIIYGEEVKGEVSIHLNEVPFREALNTLLKISGLVLEEIASGVIKITTPEKMSILTGFFRLKYANAGDIKTTIDSLLTTRGKTQIDQRTNTLIVTETPDNMPQIAKAVTQLDIKIAQVEIEARILEVEVNSLEELGISWGIDKPRFDPTGATSEEGGETTTTGESVEYIPPSKKGVVQGMILNELGQTDLTLGTVISNATIDMTINAIVSNGKGKVLSNPKITTLNNKPATINITDKIPFEKKTLSTSGTGDSVVESTIEFLDVGILLEVTPSINPEGEVTLMIHPNISTYTLVELGPIIHTREANTTVVVKNNETIVIAGLIKEEDRKLMKKVPLLGDIPILKFLFHSESDSSVRTELLIFITPHILSD